MLYTQGTLSSLQLTSPSSPSSSRFAAELVISCPNSACSGSRCSSPAFINTKEGLVTTQIYFRSHSQGAAASPRSPRNPAEEAFREASCMGGFGSARIVYLQHGIHQHRALFPYNCQLSVALQERQTTEHSMAFVAFTQLLHAHEKQDTCNEYLKQAQDVLTACQPVCHVVGHLLANHDRHHHLSLGPTSILYPGPLLFLPLMGV